MTDYFNDNDLIKLFASDPEEHAGGPSELRNILMCARQHVLKLAAAKAEGEALDTLGPRTHKRNTGSLTHKLVELYHAGEDPALLVPRHSEVADINAILQEGWGLFERYKQDFPLGFWGRVLATEVELHGEDSSRGRVDAIIDVDEAAAERIAERFPGQRPVVGVHIWDLKVTWQKNNNLDSEYGWSLAGTQYCALARGQGIPVDAFTVFNMVSYKTQRQEYAFLATFPVEAMTSDAALRRLDTARGHAAELLSFPGGMPNTVNCHRYGECIFKTSGQCKGY
jgi:hypothetical protein